MIYSIWAQTVGKVCFATIFYYYLTILKLHQCRCVNMKAYLRSSLGGIFTMNLWQIKWNYCYNQLVQE